MKKLIAVVMVLGLIGSFAAPVSAAKKKKKKPVATPVTFFFHNDSGACTDDAAFVMKLTEATEGSNCGNLLYGAGYEAGNAAGLSDPYTYYAVEGVPFVLDATQKIVATVQVSSRSVAAGVPAYLGAGQTTLVASISGQSGDETKELGAAKSTYAVTPAQGVYEVVLEFQPPAELDKATFTSLSIDLHQTGQSVNHGFYRTVNPASKILVPTWK